MKRREFINLLGVSALEVGLLLSFPNISVSSNNSQIQRPINDSSKNKIIKNLEEDIEDMRNLTDTEIPSRELILNHYEELFNNYWPYFQSASKAFNIPQNYIKAICGIEQGKPFVGFSTGLALESPTGPKGIGQLSFNSFVDSCYFNWLNKDRIQGSELDIFNSIVQKSREDAERDKKTVWDIVNEKKPEKRFSREDRQNLYGALRYEKFKDNLKTNLKKEFDKLFSDRVQTTEHGEGFFGPAIQIHTMGAYLRRLNNILESMEFTIGSYNHGISTTRKIIEQYLDTTEKKKRFRDIAKNISSEELSYQKIYSYEDVLDTIEYIKSNWNLEFLDKDYYLKTKIAQKEIECFDLQKGIFYKS